MGRTVVIAVILVNLSEAPPALVDEACDEVVALFAEIGVDVRWVAGVANAGPELWRVTILPTAPPGVGFDAGILGSAGSAAIETPAAWVFFKQIQRVAWRRHVPVRALLSRTIAHEIGHLLQQVKGHTATGLMRPNWQHGDFRLLAQGRFRFTPEDVASFTRGAVLAR